MRYVGTIIKTLLIACLVLFSFFNKEDVLLVLYPGQLSYNVPLFLVVIVSILLGIVVTSFVFLNERWKLAKEIKSLKKQMDVLQEENTRLHNLPLLRDGEEI